MHKTILFDQLTPVAFYGKIRDMFPDEISMLFESVVNSSEGNYSFITVGAKERLVYKDKTSIYTDAKGNVETLTQDPFAFLKSYYAALDKQEYKKIAAELGFSFVELQSYELEI